jgi:tRNA A37 methylthiotransferase MiaB
VDTIRKRARELRAIGERKKAEFARAQVGKRAWVLTLNSNGKMREGAEHKNTRAVSTNYVDLKVEGSWPANQWLDVRIESFNGARLSATHEA